MEEKSYYFDYDKVFVSPDLPGTNWHATVSRADYLDLPVAMIPEEMSDAKMQQIANGIAVNMFQEYDAGELTLLDWYRTEGIVDMTDTQIDKADRMAEREFEFFETFATQVGMRYWEDLDEDEANELEKVIAENSVKINK